MAADAPRASGRALPGQARRANVVSRAARARAVAKEIAADGKVLVRSEKCDEVRANSTDVAVTWGGGRALGAVLPLKLPATVRLEFVARGRVALYSFWVGES